MRQVAFALSLALVCASPIGAQDKKSAKPAPKTLSLSGCVVRGESTPNAIRGSKDALFGDEVLPQSSQRR